MIEKRRADARNTLHLFQLLMQRDAIIPWSFQKEDGVRVSTSCLDQELKGRVVSPSASIN